MLLVQNNVESKELGFFMMILYNNLQILYLKYGKYTNDFCDATRN
jgi:hypothetical protein